MIYSLSSGGKNIPSFRESKLTRLLQDSLTANTFTFIIGNISPSANNADETMNTLKFVERARHVLFRSYEDRDEGQADVVQRVEHVSCEQTPKISTF